MKKELTDRTVWRTRVGRQNTEQTKERMKENTNELSNVYSKTHDVPLQNSVHIN